MEVPSLFAAGTRVKVSGHSEWPDGTRGTIGLFPSFVREMCSDPPHGPDDFFAAGLGRRSKGRVGALVSQWVEFDEPTDDGSGDGPYRHAEILLKYLNPASEAGRRARS